MSKRLDNSISIFSGRVREFDLEPNSFWFERLRAFKVDMSIHTNSSL